MTFGDEFEGLAKGQNQNQNPNKNPLIVACLIAYIAMCAYTFNV